MATGAEATQGLEAVVLAAGAGRRFGGGKLLTPWNGAPLLHAALRAAFAAPVRGVTVATGSGAEAVAEAARAFDSRVRIVHAAEHEEGIAASLRTAIASLPPDSAGALVFLGDMPRVPHAVLRPLAEALQTARAAAPVFDGRRGNPAALSSALFPQLLDLKGDQGARAVLDALGPDLALIEAPDDGVLFDVDRPGDLAQS